MGKRERLLAMVLGVAMMVSLTLACSLSGVPGGGDVVPGEEEVPGVQPPAEESPTPQPLSEETAAPPGNEFDFEMDAAALDSLDSYGYTFHIDGLSTMEGAVEVVDLNIDGKRQLSPARAEHLVFQSFSETSVEYMELVYVEDLARMWIKDGEGDWQEMPAVDESVLQMFDALSLRFWWDAVQPVVSPDTVQFVGEGTINGVPARHYRNTESTILGSAVAGCTFASFEDLIWVAVEGSFPVKRELSAEATCEGESGTFNLFMEIRDVNQPQEINPPL